ncbi:hypothetical protein PLICRDRAFT_122356 [Plicaturopsis crispa FD-325 SS-3]|nr:hypothetical protein PLICRDRAFT_122356 [Plicaturopsis crispa FD-325 SS-3]
MQVSTDPGADITVDTNDIEHLLHPLFASPDGDVLLGTQAGGILFRVHSHTLKTTSGWFRTMFSLPQKSEKPASTTTIAVDEDAHTLETLLRMICGLPILPITSYDEIDALLYAAEKYDMPGPMSIVRVLIMTPELLQHPLRLYAVACRFGWEVEAKFASTQTLHINLHDAEHRPALQRLGTDALLNLFDLHRRRREGLRKRLDDPPFVGGGTTVCQACGSVIDYHTWRELKYKIILEMDVRPLGDTIVNTGLLDWNESKACWSAKCPNVDCDRVLYDKGQTLLVIKDFLYTTTMSMLRALRAAPIRTHKFVAVPPRQFPHPHRYSAPLGLRANSTSAPAPRHRFVIYAPDATDEGAYARRMEVREKHLALARRLSGEGFIKLGGAMLTPESIESPTAERKIIGSVFICEAESLAQVRKYAEEDLYYTAGVWDKEKLVILPFQAATPFP